MAVLEKAIQDKIDEISNLSYDYYAKGEKEKSYELMEQAWDLYPDPKSKWNESYGTAKFAFDDLLNDGKTEKAKIWLNRMLENNNELHLHDNDIEFNIGKYYFETGDYQKAKNEWDYVVKEAGYRYFENEKSEYLDFYNNPEKYLK